MSLDAAPTTSSHAVTPELVRRQLAALPSPQRILEEIFVSAPVGLQLVASDGRCVLVNPVHTRLFGAVPPPDYNIFDDTVLAQSGMAGLVRRAFAGERITIPPIWYDARDLQNVRVTEGRRFAVSAELVPLATDGSVTHVLFVFHDVSAAHETREQAETAAQRSGFLAEAGRLLSSSLELNETLTALARLATPTLADYCVVDILDAQGEVHRVAAAHADPAAQHLVDALLRYRPVRGSPQPARRVLDSGQPELLEVVDPEVVTEHTIDPAHQLLMQQLGVRSHLALPLVGRAGTIGAISLGYVGDRRYVPADVALGEALASRAALAIENARLYDDVARSEQRFRRMADAVPHIIWIAAGDGTIEFFNREWHRYTGQPVPVSAGENAQMHLHPDDAGPTMERFNEALATQGTFLVEHRIRSASGEYRWFLVRGVPQRDEQTGKVVRWYGASMDIHDLKLAQDALREADRRKDEFLAMLAHELRNPLAVISNTWWLVKKTAAPELEKYLDVLGRQTRRLTALVDDLLDVSRVTRGLITLKQERLDLNRVAERALESLQATLDERRHEVTITLARRPLWVLGDQARLEQVVVNLLTNACKYTDPGGHIAVVLSARDGWAQIELRDDGIGMSPEFLGHIFDLFAQAERGLARSQGGLGVGLTIVKRLVELHGGTIAADSPGLGRGSTFTVRLPLQADSSAPDTAPAPRPGGQGAARSILVVDDNADSAATLALVLETTGHQVRTAHDGTSALALAQQHRPEVVLLDIGLPDLDGYEVARRLRGMPALRGLVLVALTGYGQPADRELAAAAGFDQHFVKPVEIAALEAYLGSLRR